MGSREFSEWMAYYAIEPWGEDRADLRLGILASLTANINRGKNAKPYKPSDFMPYRRKENMSDEVDDLKSFLRRKSG